MKKHKKRKEEVFWEKVQALWQDWKVTISIVWFFCLATIGIIVFSVINWTTGTWRGGGFSGEVDAAMINSLVAIFVTVPITLLTGAGTILVTVYFNLQTQKMAIQSQRSALRDKILEKRLEIYPEILRLARVVEYAHSGVVISTEEKRRISLQEGLNDLQIYYNDNKPFLSQEVKNLFGYFFVNVEEFNDGYSNRDHIFTDFRQAFQHQIEKELNFKVLENDWKFLQQYRIDEE